jgi:hypothetical protein
MTLWNDYEGKIVAERFRLETLLFSEGRSGFFYTHRADGSAAVVRLTEVSGFGRERETLLRQWEVVRRLNHPNLLEIQEIGATVVGRTDLVYAVLASPDLALAEALAERSLTVEETTQIGASATAALRALHTAGLAHGRIDASNVLAVGEVVKLRGDCVRQVANRADAAESQAADVQALCLLLLECLTRSRTQEDKAEDAALPPPFDRIVRYGVAGSWGLEEISRELESPGSVADPVAVEQVAVKQVGIEPTAILPIPGKPVQSKPVEDDPLPVPEPSATLNIRNEVVANAAPARLQAPGLPMGGMGRLWDNGVGAGAAAAVALLAAIGSWYALHPMTAEDRAIAYPKVKVRPAAAARIASPLPFSQTPAAQTPVLRDPVVRDPVTPGSGLVPDATVPAESQTRGTWRVVAFSYAQASQARKRVSALTRSHYEYRPQVFTPTGDAPYLVTLGGPMSREEALAVMQQARDEGIAMGARAEDYGPR